MSLRAAILERPGRPRRFLPTKHTKNTKAGLVFGCFVGTSVFGLPASGGLWLCPSGISASSAFKPVRVLKTNMLMLMRE